MNSEELKKKILNEINKHQLFGGRFGNRGELLKFPNELLANLLSELLIAAGIGDVKEAEHRAFVAERALKNMAADYWGVECFCHGCSESRCRESCGEKYLVYDEEDAVSCLFKNFLEQAEKELTEERNVKN